MKKLAWPMIGVLTCSCLVTSCSSLKVQSWTDPEFKGRDIGKTMVLGVNDSDAVRHKDESHFVSQLTALGLEAETNYSVFPKASKLTKEEVVQALKRMGADSLIVTTVVSEKDKMRYDEPSTYHGRYGDFYGYYGWTHSYVHDRLYLSNYIEIHLETNLYDVESEKLVWSGQKIVTDDHTEDKNIKSVVHAVIRELVKEGMISGTGK